MSTPASRTAGNSAQAMWTSPDAALWLAREVGGKCTNEEGPFARQLSHSPQQHMLTVFFKTKERILAHLCHVALSCKRLPSVCTIRILTLISMLLPTKWNVCATPKRLAISNQHQRNCLGELLWWAQSAPPSVQTDALHFMYFTQNMIFLLKERIQERTLPMDANKVRPGRWEKIYLELKERLTETISTSPFCLFCF